MGDYDPVHDGRVEESPSGVLAGTVLLSEASTTVSRRHVDSRTSPEALKENHPRNGSRQSEEKGGCARDGQGESAQRGRSPEDIIHTRARDLRPSSHFVKARAAAGRQTLVADFRWPAAAASQRPVRLRQEENRWGKGVLRSVPPAFGARSDPGSSSVCFRATGRDFRRKLPGVLCDGLGC